ncbi:uncharacterized protein [Rutidosis leptorrhynchoides]|uniref:uncharacterized protein n=1 Tax=Rutidosis leptorrhynchoides TaxID=125765 RepID=UPI003A98F5DD
MVASVTEEQPNWMNPILHYIRSDILPDDNREARLFMSVAHPQANGLCEVTNCDIISGIKKRLCEKRTGWVDELPNMLWAHHTTFKKSTGETPFSLVYGSEVVVLAEILVPTHRRVNFEEEANDAVLSENLNFIEERRLMAAIIEANNK